MTPFYFDIETIPAQAPDVRAEIAASITAPAQYKKQESIDAWLAENREPETEDRWLKTSFDGGVGHMVCIGWAVGDGPVYCYSVSRAGNAADERRTMEDFFCALEDAGTVTLVGHNIVGFDIPFLWKRAMVLGVKPPFTFPRNPKPWSDLVCDTMALWDSQQRAGGSMARICRLLGIEHEGDIGGADVWPAIKAGEFTKVVAHCRADVDRTRQMHKRMTFA
jgi:3'-5' exonuclease